MTRSNTRKRLRERYTWLSLRLAHVADLGRVSPVCFGEVEQLTFAKHYRIGRCPSLTIGEETETAVRRRTHNKYSIHGINARRHKSRTSIHIFEVILLSPVPG